jgi:hypothetical protein
MKSPAVLSVLFVCSAGLHAQGLSALSPTGAPTQANPAAGVTPIQSDTALGDGELAPWRTTFNSTKITLGQVRFIFLYQEVLIGGTVEDLGKSSQLLEWRIAAQTPDTISSANSGDQKTPRPARYFVPHAMDGLPLRYSGKKATVIAVQLHNSAAPEARDNALGQGVTDDSTINPCFDLVVKFDDGTTAITTQYPTSLANAELAEPLSVINAAAERMRRELPDFVGKSIYAAGFTDLYKPESSIDQIVRQEDTAKVPPADIPLLVPLTIVAARYVDSAGVLIEVEFPDGNKAIALTSLPQLFLPPLNGREQTLLQRVIGLFFADIPHRLTKRETSAIKSGSIYRGMSLYALECLMGFPDKETNVGDGEKQLIFRKTLQVHLGYGGTVADWKFLDEK